MQDSKTTHKLHNACLPLFRFHAEQRTESFENFDKKHRMKNPFFHLQSLFKGGTKSVSTESLILRPLPRKHKDVRAISKP
jgi:hypothetical protein